MQALSELQLSELSSSGGAPSRGALFAAHVYTDNAFVIIAGTDRAVRWVYIWGELVRRSRSRMAIPGKRLAGADGVWCGVANIPCIGVAHTERVKTVRACAVLSRVTDCDATLIWGDYRSLTGLLEHLLPIVVGMNRRYMHELYHLHRFAKAPPTTPLGSHITEAMSDRASEWYDALSSCPSVLADVLTSSSVQHEQRFRATWRIGSFSTMPLVSARSTDLVSVDTCMVMHGALRSNLETSPASASSRSRSSSIP